MEKNIQAYKVIKHIYIHIPFCIKKCNYCSFFSIKSNAKSVEKYVKFLKDEIALYKENYNILPETIYFGGGTPSLLSSEQINAILSEFNLENIKEITLEANPATLTSEYAEKFAKIPINRLSIGIQSMIDSELKMLGRIHDSNQIKAMINMLKDKGFDNISLDLIYGLPNQKLQNVVYSLSKIIELKPQHISIYCLSLEKDVPLYKKKDFIPNDDMIRIFYDEIVNILKKNEFLRYEISNFAKKGFESKHNSAYWTDKDYLGLGTSASGYIKGVRYNNPFDIEEYFDNVKIQKLLPNSHKISNIEHAQEFFFLGLRQSGGVAIDEFLEKFDSKIFDLFYHKMKPYMENGFIKKQNGRLFLSDDAFFVSNSIFSALI